MNKTDIMKSIAPGMAPLLVFILADALFGITLGLIIAVVFGIGEIIYTYVKEKSIDRFVLIDIGLIIFMGIISVIFNNPIFFKIKPAIIEAIICLVIGFSIFSKNNIILMMSKRYMKNIKFDENMITKMKKSLFPLFVIFLIHTILIIISAIWMSKAMWAFISGGLFYIIFAIYIGIEFFKNKINKNKWIEEYKDEEWFDLVNQKGEILGKAPRSICHSGKKGYMHVVIHLHVIDSKNRIILQKRALNKKVQPGKWDTAVGGHISSGESIEIGLKREAEEEIGLTDFKVVFIEKYKWETELEEELVFMFLTYSDKKFSIVNKEVDEVKAWKIKNIKEKIDKNIFTPNFLFEFEILKKKFLKLN